MLKNFGDLLVRLRAWRLNRWADALLQKSEHHKHSATQHSTSAARYWMQSSDMRALARRIRAA